MDALQLGAGNAGGPRLLRAAAIEHGIVLGKQLRNRLVDADIDAAEEGDAFALHLLDPPVDMVLLDLEVRDAVAHQSARPALALVDVDLVAGAAELLCGGHSRRPGTDDRDALAGLPLRRLRPDIAHFERLVGNRLFDRLDGDRDVLDVERAGLLAGRRADAAGPFREIVGGVEVADRAFPVAAVDEVVPVGNLVVHRAAVRPVTERHAAIHAARGLFLDFLVRHRERELPEMTDAIRGRLILVHLPVDLEETCHLAHFSLTQPGGLGPQPVLYLQPRKDSEVAIIRHDRRSECQRVGGNQEVVRAHPLSVSDEP